MEKLKKGRKVKLENSNDWGKRLASILKERELSHRAAAKLAGVSPSVVDSWVQGRFPSNPIAIKNLADKLDLSFTYLMTGEQERGISVPTIAEVFESQDFFEGVMRVKLERLVPKKKLD